MNNLRKFFVVGVSLFGGIVSSQAQVITVSPVFPKETDTITVTYDASLGNAALKGVSQVYAHAGVITSLSTSGSDWKHVVGTWGTADARVKMTSLGNDKWQMRYHMKSFYAQASAFAPNEVIQQLAFVFRTADGSKVGRTSAGGDIFSPVYSANSSLLLKITLPENKTTIGKSSDVFSMEAWASKKSSLGYYLDGNLIRTVSSQDSIRATVTSLAQGSHKLKVVASAGSETASDSVSIVINPSVSYITTPAGLEQGINYVNDSTVYLVLYAPYKTYVYAIGDFSNWQPSPEFYMNFDPSKSQWWVKIEHLTPGKEYGYQYLVEGKLRIHDPFSPLLLNEWDDAYIPATTYPNLKAYPKNSTSGSVTVMQPGEPGFAWSKMNFQRPSKDKLIIYECLVRDFTKAQTFKALQDSLTYLKRLGINAIELMPVTEFEGNLSWGYNVANHMAIDKYYGSRLAFKSLVNACHEQGIAVIMDAVFNHAFSTAAICQLYWDPANNQPTGNSPYANVVAKHPFNVGYDLNHESSATRYYFKRITKYLMQEYHIDGFRFDLSKGFTQTNSGSDVNLWGQYDASRVSIWTDYYNHITSVDKNGFYVILEHFADNSEEKELARLGMMLWGNANYNSLEASMGYSGTSDFGWGFDAAKRGWNTPNLIGYAGSHDEERMAYKTITNGNSASGYSTRSNPIFLHRSAMMHSFVYLIPGPKMIWQFDELGYDYSINYCANGTINNACRTDAKPVRWDYWTGTDKARKKLYFQHASFAHLKKTYNEISAPNSYALTSSGLVKRLAMTGTNFNTIVLANVDVVSQSTKPNFTSLGYWYNYITGDSLLVQADFINMTLAAGEYQIWTNKRVENPFWDDLKTLSNNKFEESNLSNWVEVYPNPAKNILNIYIKQGMKGAAITFYNLEGKIILTKQIENTEPVNIEELAKGIYLVRIQSADKQVCQKILID